MDQAELWRAVRHAITAGLVSMVLISGLLLLLSKMYPEMVDPSAGQMADSQ